jgi:hypothetical protein
LSNQLTKAHANAEQKQLAEAECLRQAQAVIVDLKCQLDAQSVLNDSQTRNLNTLSTQYGRAKRYGEEQHRELREQREEVGTHLYSHVKNVYQFNESMAKARADVLVANSTRDRAQEALINQRIQWEHEMLELNTNYDRLVAFVTQAVQF